MVNCLCLLPTMMSCFWYFRLVFSFFHGCLATREVEGSKWHLCSAKHAVFLMGVGWGGILFHDTHIWSKIPTWKVLHSVLSLPRPIFRRESIHHFPEHKLKDIQGPCSAGRWIASSLTISFSATLFLLFQGHPGPAGPQGPRGLRGAPVSCLSQWLWGIRLAAAS